jgi:pimeloyl-ACP methyl ester carboxylesterase
MKIWMIALSGIATLLLSGCGESSDNFSASDAVGGYVILDAKAGNIPYPNDILISQETGYIHFETNTSDPAYPIKSALNTLDGFSTTSPITVGLSCDIDTSTLQDHIVVIDLITMQPLTYGEAFVASYSDRKLVILPRKPFESNHRYLVILKKGITNTAGQPIAPDYLTSLILSSTPLLNSDGTPTTILDKDPQTNLERLKTFEAIRQYTQKLITIAENMDIPQSEILNIWSFKTQTIGKVAKAFADQNYSQAVLGLQDTNLTSKDILSAAGYDTSAMSGIAEVYAGTLSNLPYYLGIPTQTDPTAPLQKSFEFEDGSNLPNVEANVTIPVLVTVPNSDSNCSMPTNGWPVVIFQHGITQNRTNLLPISERFAKICYATVAIDLPLHGIDDNTNPLYMGNLERTFNVDYVTQDSECNIIATEPDGKIDCSGTHYINLQSLLTARDNLRQSTSDLIALQNALGTAYGVKFDATKVSYVGHSLGTMAPFGFFAHRKLDAVVLANPGGGIAELLNNSPRFGPSIEAGLAAKGIEKGSPEYNFFMLATQTIIDDADPINYAKEVAQNQKILSFEVIDDQVIPNSVATALLSGTEPLLKLMGAKSISDYDYTIPALVTLETNNTVTRFTDGTHSSFLLPDVPSVTREMQSQMASFIQSKGQEINITNDRIIE